ELLAEGTGPALPAAQAPAAPAPREKRYETEVALAHVAKAYGARRLFSDLSWTFGPERLHVVAGPSGSGKTTLVNLVAALDYPDAGQVWVGGERIDGLNADDAARWRQRVLGYVSQHSTLVDFLSARENGELALRLRRGRGVAARRGTTGTSDVASTVGLGHPRTDGVAGGPRLPNNSKGDIKWGHLRAPPAVVRFARAGSCPLSRSPGCAWAPLPPRG